MTEIISIVSGKGGVGKTTLASNLASILNKFGKRVLVIDANVSAANLGIHLGINDYPSSLQSALENAEEKIMFHKEGFAFMPSHLNYWKANLKNLKLFLREYLGYADYIVIDAAAGLTEEAEHAINMADHVLVVTNPELTAISTVNMARKLLALKNKKVMGVVLNKLKGERWELNEKEIAEFLELPVIAKIPDEKRVRESIALGKTLASHAPHTKAAREMEKIACLIMGKEVPSESFWSKINNATRFLK